MTTTMSANSSFKTSSWPSSYNHQASQPTSQEISYWARVNLLQAASLVEKPQHLMKRSWSMTWSRKASNASTRSWGCATKANYSTITCSNTIKMDNNKTSRRVVGSSCITFSSWVASRNWETSFASHLRSRTTTWSAIWWIWWPFTQRLSTSQIKYNSNGMMSKCTTRSLKSRR